MRRVILILLASMLAPVAVCAQGIRYSPGPKMKPAMLPAQMRSVLSAPSGVTDWKRTGRFTQPTLSCWPDGVLGAFNCKYGVNKTAVASNAGTPSYDGSLSWWPFATFADSTDYIDFGDLDVITDDFTYFGLVKPDAVNAQQVILCKDAAANNRSMCIYFDSTARLTSAIWKDNSTLTSHVCTTSPMLAGKWNRIAITYDFLTAGTSISRMRVNGTDCVDSTTFTGPPQQTSSKLQLGRRDYTTSPIVFNGSQGGFELWAGRAMTTAELTTASDGIAHWKIVALGDSITQGTSSPYPKQLNNSIGYQYLVANGGVSGNTVTQMQARWNSIYAGGGYSWLLLLGGTNDVVVGTSNAIDTYATWLAIVNDAQARGMSVIAFTLPPAGNYAGWSADKQTQIEALNTLIGTTAGVTVVDLYSLFGGADPTKLSATYDSGDGLHPNVAGHTEMAAQAAAVIAP